MLRGAISTLLATWPRGLKHGFSGDRVITIARSRFNSHPRRTRYCVFKLLYDDYLCFVASNK